MLLADLRVNNFDKHGSEQAFLVELATGNDFIKFVEWDLEHDLFHVIL